MAASFVVAYRLSDAETATGSTIAGGRVIQQKAAAIPWVLLMLAYYTACVWVLLQPMQMRGAI